MRDTAVGAPSRRVRNECLSSTPTAETELVSSARAEPATPNADIATVRLGSSCSLILTTAPEPDVAPIHNRQVVALPKADWMAWLHLTRPEAELLKALPPGRLTLTRC